MAVVSAMALVVFALPAAATVDEITGMWCSGGNAIFGPPGITGGSNAPNNFAQPLFANRFASIDFSYDGSTATPPGAPAPLVSFDFDHPASKIVATGDIVFVPFAGVYITEFELDSEKGFFNCKALS